MEFPEGLKYTKDHEWMRAEGDEVVFGITDYAQDQLGDIVYVELPEDGTTLTRGEPFGSVEAVKAVADLISPVSGDVLAINEALNDDPSVVNRSPYEEGWMVRAKPGDPAELDALLDSEGYRKLVEELGG
ncbi:MAG: glycine cleavage system protein GcvH [Candidatus Eisenbacteria sp.]|nr:glycine cleavage system protein GcvH [Candidatus Eisenbacteria bacterium]